MQWLAPRRGLGSSRSPRVRLAAALAAVVVVVIGLRVVWRAMEPTLRVAAPYRIDAESIAISPPPGWIAGDVKRETLALSGLLEAEGADALSVLDPPERLEQRLAAALTGHPCVWRVTNIDRLPPNQLRVELEYRAPLAAIETRSGFWLVDHEATHLPRGRLTDAELARLPRILLREPLPGEGAATPALGQPWADSRVRGATSLVASFGADWFALRMQDVAPAVEMRTPDGMRYPTFTLRSRGGTHIVWGAAPGWGPTTERPFAQKLADLQRYVAQNGPLDSVAGTPKGIDLRNGLRITPRVVRRDSPDTQPVEEPIKQASPPREVR